MKLDSLVTEFFCRTLPSGSILGFRYRLRKLITFASFSKGQDLIMDVIG